MNKKVIAILATCGIGAIAAYFYKKNKDEAEEAQNDAANAVFEAEELKEKVKKLRKELNEQKKQNEEYQKFLKTYMGGEPDEDGNIPLVMPMGAGKFNPDDFDDLDLGIDDEDEEEEIDPEDYSLTFEVPADDEETNFYPADTIHAMSSLVSEIDMERKYMQEEDIVDPSKTTILMAIRRIVTLGMYAYLVNENEYLNMFRNNVTKYLEYLKYYYTEGAAEGFDREEDYELIRKLWIEAEELIDKYLKTNKEDYKGYLYLTKMYENKGRGNQFKKEKKSEAKVVEESKTDEEPEKIEEIIEEEKSEEEIVEEENNSEPVEVKEEIVEEKEKMKEITDEEIEEKLDQEEEIIKEEERKFGKGKRNKRGGKRR